MPSVGKRGVVVQNFKGEGGNSKGDGKANVWETNVCWARQRQWDSERNFNQQIL